MSFGSGRVKSEFGVARHAARSDLRSVDADAGSVMVGWTTTATRDDALRLARSLIEARLAACAQVSEPIVSVYRWEGRVNESEEFRVTVKFASARAGEIDAWLAKHHPYSVPQWVCCRADAVSEKYLKWVVDDSS